MACDADGHRGRNADLRLKRVREHLIDEEAFCFTYGDGVADIDIGALIAFHGWKTGDRYGRASTWTIWGVDAGGR